MSIFTEAAIGIHGYTTSGELKIDGYIKASPGTFIVEEIPIDFPRDEKGKYLYLKVRLYNWDTNHFLNEVARNLGISRKRVSYAGSKDKRAITTQYFCINAEIEGIDLKIKDVEILEQFRSPHMLRLGDLLGNRFAIKIESESDNQGTLETLSGEIAINGFPNFFGPQRFGSFRPNTHKVGKLIVQGRTEEAVDEYICDPELDEEWFRREFNNSGDVQQALKDFPPYLSNERSMLYKIAEGRKATALNALPLQLRMLFVHAYQSYIYNRIVSKRLDLFHSVKEVLDGDTCFSIDSMGNPLDEPIKVSSFNMAKISGLVTAGNVAVSAPLPGFNSELSRGVEGEIEREIYEEEMLEFPRFRIPEYPELSSGGSWRIISGKLTNPKITSPNTTSFSLGKGMYATSVIREFLKKDRLEYFSGADQKND